MFLPNDIDIFDDGSEAKFSHWQIVLTYCHILSFNLKKIFR